MSASEIDTPQSYRPEEVQQILQLAITRKTEQDELSRQQLWEIAAELDIDRDSLQLAEADWLNQRLLNQKRQEFDGYRREKFRQAIARFSVINLFLVTINLMVAHHLSWSGYILGSSGLWLTFKAWQTYQQKGEAYEQAFQSWNVRNEFKRSVQTLWNRVKDFWQT